MKQMLLKVPEEFYDEVVGNAKTRGVTMRDEVIAGYSSSNAALTVDELRCLIDAASEVLTPTRVDEAWLDVSVSTRDELVIVIGGDDRQIVEKCLDLAFMVGVGDDLTTRCGRRVSTAAEPTTDWCSEDRVRQFKAKSIKVFERLA